ncbi:MAG: NADP oxidoreductase, partial [Gammaproteobacteria bacterium]|nr:NADP oxidoreductase [Gammaproteobacteria bacterium]
VFGFEGRGIRERIAVNSADGLVSTDVEAADAAVSACPTGCLLVKRQGNRVPIGQRAYDKTPIGSDVIA